MEQLPKKHDALFKKSLENTPIAQDFFKAHLPKNIQEKIDFSTLRVEKDSFLNAQYLTNFGTIDRL